MKIHVDMDKCICAGMCISTAPKLFELDSDGRLVVINTGSLNDEELRLAEDAALCCPAEAIELVAGDTATTTP
jgi:ferredoxin